MYRIDAADIYTYTNLLFIFGEITTHHNHETPFSMIADPESNIDNLTSLDRL